MPLWGAKGQVEWVTVSPNHREQPGKGRGQPAWSWRARCYPRIHYCAPASLLSQRSLFFLEPSATLWPSVDFKLTLPSPERQTLLWNKYQLFWHVRQIQKLLQESRTICFKCICICYIYTCLYVCVCRQKSSECAHMRVCVDEGRGYFVQKAKV